MITIIALAAILTACTSNQSNTDIDTEKQQPIEQNQIVQHNNEQAKESSNQWASLPEYNTIIQHVDVEDYSFKIVTDNESKRILTLQNEDGKPQFKSIFIKRTNRLKIIDLEDEGQIYNDVLNESIS